MDEAKILQEHISRLNFTEAFCEQSFAMGYHCVGEIIGQEPAHLITQKGFTYAWLAELSSYLSKNGLLYRFQPIPGSNGG